MTLQEALNWIAAIQALLVVPLFGWVVRVERELATIRAVLLNLQREHHHGKA